MARWSIRANVVTGNYATSDVAMCLGRVGASAACNFAGNSVLDNHFGDLTAAEPIRAAAGLEPAFGDLAPP
jgi:hypothetical protein